MKDNKLLQLIFAWIIIFSIFVLLTKDEGIYYADIPLEDNCTPDYMGGCD